MLNNELFVILHQSMDVVSGEFPPVVVSLPVWELEVNKANEVRYFSVTHANVLVKSVHMAFTPPSLHRGVESLSLLSGFVAAHELL